MGFDGRSEGLSSCSHADTCTRAKANDGINSCAAAQCHSKSLVYVCVYTCERPCPLRPIQNVNNPFFWNILSPYSDQTPDQS